MVDSSKVPLQDLGQAGDSSIVLFLFINYLSHLTERARIFYHSSPPCGFSTLRLPSLTMSSTPYDVPALLKAIDTYGKNVGKNKGEARRQCLAAARELCYALETPIESILRVSWAEVSSPSTTGNICSFTKPHFLAITSCRNTDSR